MVPYSVPPSRAFPLAACAPLAYAARLRSTSPVRCPMHAPFRKYVPLGLLITIVSTASSCSTRDDPTPTAPTTHVTATLTTEPTAATPEFVPNASCRTVPAFRTSLVVV